MKRLVAIFSPSLMLSGCSEEYIFLIPSGECVPAKKNVSEFWFEKHLERMVCSAVHSALSLRELFPSVGRNVESKIDIAKRYYVQSKPSQRRKEHDEN